MVILLAINYRNSSYNVFESWRCFIDSLDCAHVFSSCFEIMQFVKCLERKVILQSKALKGIVVSVRKSF